MGKRTWIKVYCDKWVSGTLRDETPEIRCCWIDLLALVGNSQNSDTGELKLANGIGYSDEQISDILRIEIPLWLKAKQRFVDTDRIILSSKNEIAIKNWTKYQSEYSRQKPYRNKEKSLHSKEREVRL